MARPKAPPTTTTTTSATHRKSKPPTATTTSPRKDRSLRPRSNLSSYADTAGDWSASSDVDPADEDGEYSSDDHDDPEPEEDEEEEEEDEAPATPLPERGANGTRSLRPRAALGQPEGLKDYVSTDAALGHKKRPRAAAGPAVQRVAKGKRLPPGKACMACRASRRRCDRKKPRCSGCSKAGVKCCVKEGGGGGGGGGGEEEEEEDDGAWGEEEKGTIRGQIRRGMEETGRKRERFLLEYGHLFEALLPESNYIAKLRAKYAARNEKVEANANANANDLLPEVKAEAGIEVEVEVRGEDKPAAEAVVGDGEAKPESKTEIQVEDKPEVTTELGAKVKAAGSEPAAAPQAPTELSAVPYKLLEKQPPK